MTPSSEPTASGSPSAEPSPREVVTAWRQLAPAAGGPIPREDHTWTVDGEGEVAYLFGGRNATGPGTLDDFWAFDLEDETWSELPAGPAGRFGHNASWVPGVGVVIFAGQGDAGFFNDLWAYDPVVNGWRELPAAGAIPVRRYGSCAALGPDGRLLISHGFTSEGARFSDTALAHELLHAAQMYDGIQDPRHVLPVWSSGNLVDVTNRTLRERGY